MRCLRFLLIGCGFIAWVAVSGIAGALGLSAITYLVDWLFFRRIVEGGQYGWTFLLTIPTGFVLGAVSGLAGGLLFLGKRNAVGSVCVAGGCLLVLMLLDQTRALGLLTFAAPYFLPLIWAALLIAAGVRTLNGCASPAGTEPTQPES